MSNPNPLLSPPFYTIPGVDPNSPISAQTERIDQLNTLLLQEIDANFARFHQIVTSRILPEIKRFAIAGEPTREAAHFWRSFFEAASSIRLPGSTDTTLPHQQDHATQYDDQTMTMRRDQDDSQVHAHAHDESGSSFIFDPPATSSTPLPAGRSGVHESWEDSMESPFDRLDRKLRDELKIGQPYQDQSGVSSDLPTPSLPSGYSLPHLSKNASSVSTWNQSPSVRPQNADDTQQEEYSTGTVNPQDIPTHGQAQSGRPSSATPRANKTKTTSASNNPFGAGFTGIADLRSTPLNAAKMKSSKIKKPPKQSILPGINDEDSSDEEGAGGIPFGMSPPVTMKFSLPPKAQAVFDIAKTPAKSTTQRSTAKASNGMAAAGDLGDEGEKQAKFILDDLLEEMGSELSPRLNTPEGLGRYSIMPGDLQPGQGKLLFSQERIPQQPITEEEGEENTYHPSGSASASGAGGHPQPYAHAHAHAHAGIRRSTGANTSFESDMVDLPVGQEVYSAEDSFEGDSFDSMDEGMSDPTHTAGTGTGTGTGTGVSGTGTGTGTGTISSVPYSTHENNRIIGGDDSFLSSEGDMTRQEDISEAGVIFGQQPSHIPSHHQQYAAKTREAQDAARRKSQFELMKRDEMDTYFGGKLEDAAGNDVLNSPTHQRRVGVYRV
ncbi:uncharacterized protein I303_106801 [Kwoniella dejecticola CBS 10117]|uniref:DASH complex subunit ASK1 n=1 Tax=Kwoniella dejecticola CBS 10117 TaxID=1296121 RepID=A0A1A5ZTN3_9TREE|nr:uncharacterized protein I303_08557 [Kwoniella dejecticola CBS 10117]OBR81172.1 hypothetical protein I303_08557 [Kwoniella dejecticola CBS 10117]